MTRQDYKTQTERIEDQIAGETTVTVACTVPEAEPDLCDDWSETVELDAPAYLDGETVHLPGYSPLCGHCGNPHEFEVNGIRLTFGL